MHEIHDKHVLKEVCDERYSSLKETVKELKQSDRELGNKFDALVENLRKEVVSMITEASKGEIKVGFSNKQLTVITVTFITSVTSIIVTLIQALGG